MAWSVTFEIMGDDFSPEKIDFSFHDQNESTDIEAFGRYKGLKYGYGSAMYRVPDEIPRHFVFKHLADTFEPLLSELKAAGAQFWQISIGRLYFAQCNEELGAEEIIQIARLRCPVAYSAYMVSEEEELNGFK